MLKMTIKKMFFKDSVYLKTIYFQIDPCDPKPHAISGNIQEFQHDNFSLLAKLVSITDPRSYVLRIPSKYKS